MRTGPGAHLPRIEGRTDAGAPRRTGAVCARLAVIALTSAALAGCHDSKAAGALALAGWGLLNSGLSRASGGCYALCIGDEVCNAETGFCERNPCGSGCGRNQRCDIWGPVPRCVDATPAADVAERTPADATVPVVPIPVPAPSPFVTPDPATTRVPPP